MLASTRKLPIPMHWLLIAATLVIAIALMMPARGSGLIYEVLMLALIALMIVVVLIQYIYLPWQVRRHHRQAASFRD